ncbi:MAG: T9SS type A sorting domain-containing protein [Bacteroidota bacterium]|jgi:hypothetical protein|nr:T9SS type A sorting domain-containing protein [Bacteroidota bacterium]
MIRRFGWLCVLAVILATAPAAQSQLVFTRSDIQQTLQDRTLTMFSAQELSGETFDLGAAGSAQVYDFRGLPYQQASYNSVFVDPAVTPYAVDYPSATHAQIFATATTAFSYMRLDDQGFYNLGFATEYSGSDYILTYDPEMPSLLFPLQLGSSWTYTSNELLPLEGFYEVTEMQVDAVSEGVLVTDHGTWPALCVRNITWLTQRIEFAGTVVSESRTQDVNYMFMTKHGVSASLGVDTLDAGSWTPRITNASLTFEQMPNAVDAPTGAAVVGIQSLHPHPVTGGVTTVTWNADGPATLSVHDNTGRELRRLTQDVHAGVTRHTQLHLGSLAPGMYFVRLQTPAGVTQRPLMIIR